MQSIIYSFLAIGPVFIVIALGVVCRRVGLVDRVLAGQLSRLVFYLFLPALLVKTFVDTNFMAMFSWKLIILVCGVYGICFILARLLAMSLKASRDAPYFFASGATWGNVAILGFALAKALYGDEGLARAGILAGIFPILHSITGIIFMDRRRKGEGIGAQFTSILSHLLCNPIIIACGLGVLLSVIPLTLPSFFISFVDMLSRVPLPLSLVAIGACLEFNVDPKAWQEPLMATGIKLILLPVFGLIFGNLLNIGAVWTGAITIAFSCPTAVSFFVISKNLGYDASRGAAIVTMTTAGSVLTTGLAAAWLKMMGYV